MYVQQWQWEMPSFMSCREVWSVKACWSRWILHASCKWCWISWRFLNKNKNRMPQRHNLINFLTSHELHNSSMMPPGHSRLVGLKGDFTSLQQSREVSSACPNCGVLKMKGMSIWKILKWDLYKINLVCLLCWVDHLHLHPSHLKVKCCY